MASRQSVMLNMDAGLWFGFLGGSGIATDLSVKATRYSNLADFAAILPSAPWNANQWGNQNKRLNDSLNGFKIRESIFTQEALDITPINDYSLAPDSLIGGNISVRASVLYSFQYSGYLYINPATTGLPADQQEFAWVPNHTEATRFTNLVPLEDLLDQSVLGDSPYGFEIQQYYFTKAIQSTVYNYFSGAPTTPRAIERAFVPYSKAKGAYLNIDISNNYTFVADPWSGTRYQNANDFLNIVNNTPLQSEAYGFELPQFYFNRAARPPKGNPFNDFWEITPIPGAGLDVGTVITWIDKQAVKELQFGGGDWINFVNNVSKTILAGFLYKEYEESFNAFMKSFDENAYEQWLAETFWKPNGG